MGERLYRAALWLLPARLRAELGDSMAALLVEELETARRRGRLTWARVLATALADVVRRAAYERWRRRRRRSKGGAGMSTLGQDIRLALRGFARMPAMTGLVVAMLALGIAANTAVFSLVNGLFLRPLPFENTERLVYLNETAPLWNLDYTGINYPDFVGWRERAGVFEAMGLWDSRSFNLSDGESADRVEGMGVTHDFAAVLGIRPVLGRMFTPEEDVPDGPAVAVIGWRLWQTRFGGARDVVGRTLRIDSRPTTIVGVLPREATFPLHSDLWVPIQADPAQTYQSYAYAGAARLREGVTLPAAQKDLERAHVPIWEAGDTARVVSPVVEDLREHYVAPYLAMAGALAGGVALLLLIACANVASVLLARTSARRREIGIRRALGADGWRVSRLLLTESLVLATVAGAAGLLIGYWATRALTTALPDQLPRWAEFSLDARTVLFTLAVSAATSLLFAWAPALQARRASIAMVLSSGSARTTASAGAQRTLNGLVVAEVALAVVLLVGGGLLLAAFGRVRDVEPGFRTDQVLGFRIALPTSTFGYDSAGTARGRAFYDVLLARVRSLPGVTAAGAISCPPLTCHQGQFVEAEGAPPLRPDQQNPVVLTRVATPGYFEALSITIENGRSFLETDGGADSAGVVIVNRMLAKHLWPDLADPVGRRLRFQGSGNPFLTVVGVAADVKHYGLDEPSRPGLYLPVRQTYMASLAVLVHASGDPLALVAPVRTIVHDLNPDLPIFQVGSIADALDRSLALRRTFARFLAMFAALALGLAAGGLYGVLSFTVTQRTREIGIRVALGARRGEVVRMILGRGMLLVLPGLVLGVLAALAAGRLLSSLLFGVSAHDPAVFGVAASVLAGTAVIANLLPAWRAARLDPQVALREESG